MAAEFVRLFEAVVYAPAEITCVACGVVDSGGTSGPGYLVREAYCLGERTDWHCRPCGDRVWAAYLAARAHRLDVIAASRVAGWPLSESQYRARMAPGVQLTLVEGM